MNQSTTQPNPNPMTSVLRVIGTTYIVEIPHQFPPSVWSRYSQEEVIEAIRTRAIDYGYDLYSEDSGHEILEIYGYETLAEARDSGDMPAKLIELLDKQGLDTIYYRAYCQYNESDTWVLTTAPADEFDAHIEWNASDLYAQYVYMNGTEAREAYEDEDQWCCHQGAEAREALRAELECRGE